MRAILWLLLAPVALASDWRSHLEEAAAESWRDHPVEAAAAANATPITTRNGLPRFVGEDVWNPVATPILLERAFDPSEPLPLRVALVEAAVRSDGDWSEAVVGQLGVEREAELRRMLAEVLREAEPGPAAVGLARASRDPDAAVRAAAMRAIGGRADGAVLSDALLRGLRDSDAKVREEAARSTGWLSLDQGWDGLATLLGDADPDVRLNAVRALERLDAARLRGLPELTALRADIDPRVARAAASIR